MSQLEGQLGFTLCQRGRGGFSLTEKGQQFLQQAIRVLSELNELERQSALLKGGAQRHPVHLDARLHRDRNGALAAGGSAQLQRQISPCAYQTDYPHPGGATERRAEQPYRLAIGSYNSQVHNIISEPLYREQHWLYCSDLHPMFFSRQLDKEQISQCPLVTRSYWNTSDLRRRGFSKGSATVETVDAQLLLILSGKYIGYLPEHYAPAVDQREPPAGAAAQRVWLSVAVLGHL